MSLRVEIVSSGTVRAASWGLLDQVLSSLTNFALTFTAARSLDPHAFGGFWLAFAAYLLALGFSRSVGSEPLVVRFSGAREEEWRAGVRQAAGTAFTVGTVAGAVAVAAGATWGGPAGESLVAMGVFFPGLLLQDIWRFAFFATGRGGAAATNDAIWAATMSVGLVALAWWGRASAWDFALVWGASGTVASLVGVAQARIVPRPSDSRAWLAAHRDLASRFSAQFLVQTGSGQAALYLIAALAGLAAVGGIRAAQVLLGPLNVVFMGTGLFAVPEASRQARSGSIVAVRRTGLFVSAGLLAAVTAWAAAAAILPDHVGEAVLGKNWPVARSFLGPVALAMAASAVSAGAATVLRGLADAGRSLRAAAFQGLLTVAAAAAGASLGGGLGAAWGLASALIVASVGWWSLCARALRDARSEARLRGVRAPSVEWETQSS
jgi:O-antigen/teichoic acid export membrane protein